MKFLKRLYACLKHYELPEVLVNGERCRMTGAWAVMPAWSALYGSEDDLQFEVSPPGRRSKPRFVSWRAIHEVSACR